MKKKKKKKRIHTYKINETHPYITYDSILFYCLRGKSLKTLSRRLINLKLIWSIREWMFPVYINDLPDELSSQVRLFADDTAYHLKVRDSDDGTVLQNDPDRLSMWESQWNMEFNPSKCQVVRVKAINTMYRLHGQALEVFTSAKCFGVDISDSQSWNSHMDRFTGKANRTLDYIKRNTTFKNP